MRLFVVFGDMQSLNSVRWQVYMSPIFIFKDMEIGCERKCIAVLAGIILTHNSQPARRIFAVLPVLVTKGFQHV